MRPTTEIGTLMASSAPLASTFCRASTLSGITATASSTTTTTSAVAVPGDASQERPVTWVREACPLAAPSLTFPTLRPDRSGNVTVHTPDNMHAGAAHGDTRC